MQFKIVHHGKRWRRVDNHMDCRHCPECGCTVNGNHGQNTHLDWHTELAEVLGSISERLRIEDDQETPWTAAVDERDDQEDISG